MVLRQPSASEGFGRVMRVVKDWLPRGEPLPADVWEGRHRGFVIFLFVQAVGLGAFGVIRGFSALHSIAEAAVVALAAALACLPKTSRRVRGILVTLGLMSASAILVHLSGGTIEAHFHFFVMVSLISLYQQWAPFLLAIGYVIVHHGLVGTIAPETVFNHPAAIQSPLKWALLHGAFVVGASVAGLLIWRRNEDLRDREHAQSLLNRALNSFNYRVAHDLKSPLVSVYGAASVAATMLDSPDDVRQILEMIQRQAKRGQSLVSSLLDLAEASGRPTLQPIRMREFLNDLSADFPQVNIEIAAIPEQIVADPTGLRQAFGNLITNAERYASDGTEAPTVMIYGEERPDGWTLAVADSGPGVRREEIDKIFEPLTRGEHATGTGSGLGLSIVAAVAEAHGGRAWYEARPGGGAEFWLYFPAVTEPRQDLPAPASSVGAWSDRSTA